MTVCHVHDPSVFAPSDPPTTAMTPEEYDKLSPEEREIKDKEDRAREKREQAGIYDHIYCSDDWLSGTLISSPLHMETRTRRSRNRSSYSQGDPRKRLECRDSQEEALSRP